MKVDRRDFFKLVAAGGAATALDACTDVLPQPYPRPALVGAEKWVDTLCGGCAAMCGISVRMMGENAVQVLGLADHPVSDGTICPRGIAEIQNLYHPDRLHGPVHRAVVSETAGFASINWEDGLARVATAATSGPVVMGIGDPPPAVAALLARIAGKLGATVLSTRLPYGQAPVDAFRDLLGSERYTFDLGHASFVLSLGADWLHASPSPVEASRAFAAIRRRKPNRGRLVTAAPRLSTTAGKSDVWIPLRQDDLAFFGMSVAHAMLAEDTVSEEVKSLAGFDAFAEAAGAEPFSPAEAAERLGIDEEVIVSVARDLAGAEQGVVVADRGDLAIQYVSVALNLLIGAPGREGGVLASPPVPLPEGIRSARLVAGVGAFPADGPRPVVLLFDANPLGLTVPSAGWQDGLQRAAFVASFSPFLDECARLAHVVLPTSTPFESRHVGWGSTLGGEAYVTGGPAVVKPLYDTRDPIQVLLDLAGLLGVELPWTDADEYRSAIAEPLEAADYLDWGGFGLVEPGSAGEDAPAPEEGDPESMPESAEGAADSLPAAPMPAAPDAEVPRAHRFANEHLPAATPEIGADPLEYPFALTTYVSSAFIDGRGAHLPYLHGLTSGVEREVWLTIAEVNEHTAHRIGVHDGERAWLVSALGRIPVVVRARQGIRPDTIAVAVGLGRTARGVYTEGFGANPLELGAPGTHPQVRLERSE